MRLTHVVGYLLLLQYHHCELQLKRRYTVLHPQLVSDIVQRLVTDTST